MFKTLRLPRARSAGLLLASSVAFAVVPGVAHASAVNLGTASPFAVLGGSSVTNTGPSVLNGDLGVSPGTSLTGFGFPAVVNGATHDDDAVAGQAQNDLTTAYNVAAGQPPTANLTGQDLGGLRLTAGAYKFSSSAGLTGRLTLDAAGDPNAQFVFEIGSTLTTASASSVQLVNGASPCNVYWQIGSSATLGTTTAFQGTVMALASISVNNGATVQGRLLARTGAVTLINDVINSPRCGGATTPGPGTPGSTSGSTPGSTVGSGPGNRGVSPTTGAQLPPASRSTIPTRRGSARLTRIRQRPSIACNLGFGAAVKGREIKRVVFRLDGRRIASLTRSPFRVHVPASFAGRGHLQARVTFKDATRAQTLNLHYLACATAVVRPLPAPSTFTG